MSKKKNLNSTESSLTLSVAETAELLGLSKGNLYAQISLKAIPYLKIGRRILIPKAALLQWLEKSGADAKTVDAIRSVSQEHSPDGKVIEEKKQVGTKGTTAVTVQQQEEAVAKSTQPGIKNTSQKDIKSNDVTKDDMKRIADALEELIDIQKEMDPGQEISPIVKG